MEPWTANFRPIPELSRKGSSACGRSSLIGLDHSAPCLDLVIRAWQRDPVTTFARIQQLLDDAAAAHTKIVFSNYLTQETVAALAGHPYSSWAAAQQDLTTPGSAPWNELSAWLQSVARRFGSNHAAESFEVMNEPNYMLGLDSQAVHRDQDTGR